jgi:DNA primase
MSDIDSVKQATNIVDLISGYVRLEKAGTSGFKGRCPFHQEKTPSFNVSPEKNMFYCFGCGKGGDAFTFVQEIEGVGFGEALRTLAEKAGIELTGQQGQKSDYSQKERLFAVVKDAERFYHASLRKDKQAVDFVLSRGINKDSIVNFRIGYATEEYDSLYQYLNRRKHRDQDIELLGLAYLRDGKWMDRFRERIMFPLCDDQGRPVGFSGRLFLKDGSRTNPDKTGKYVNSKDSVLFDKSKILYGFNKAKKALREKDQAIIVEGQIDLVLAHQIGLTETVAVSGTSFGENHARLIERFTDMLVLAYDGDDAGIKAQKKAVTVAYSKEMYAAVAELPEGKDPADMITEDEKLFKSLVKNSKDFIEYQLERFSKLPRAERPRISFLHTELYPFLLALRQPIRFDSYVQKIAGIMNISTEAVKEDMRIWEKKWKEESMNTSNELDEDNDTTDEKDRYDLFVGAYSWLLDLYKDSYTPKEEHKNLYDKIVSERKYGERDITILSFDAENKWPKNNKQELLDILDDMYKRIHRNTLEKKRSRLADELRTGPPNEQELLAQLDNINKELHLLDQSS